MSPYVHIVATAHEDELLHRKKSGERVQPHRLWNHIASTWPGTGKFQACPELASPVAIHDVYPLTPPAVSPPIRYLWNTMYKITTGTALTTAAPINWPYRGNAPPS